MFNIKVFPDFKTSSHDDKNEAALLKSLIAVRQGCGARYVNVSFFDHSGATTEAVHFLTYPTRWISHYVTGFYSDIDPLFRVDFRTISLVDWRDLYRTREQEKLIEAFSSQGLGNKGLTIVDQIEGEVYCVLSASFEISDEEWPRFKLENLEAIRFHANTIGEIYNRLFRNGRRLDYKITPREAECLYWVAMGRTDDQISALLNIGKWTVNGHLQSAKCKLGASSRSAAVAKAIVDGIITIRRAI